MKLGCPTTRTMFADLRLDQPDGRRLGDARVVVLLLVVAPGRRQGGQETANEPGRRPAPAGRTIRDGGRDDRCID